MSFGISIIILHWFPAKKDNLPWLTDDLPGRIGFSGIIAPQHVRQLYCGKMIPPQFYKKGLANPVCIPINEFNKGNLS